MTQHKHSKRIVRARMERTGESYQKALLAIRDSKPEPSGPNAGQLTPGHVHPAPPKDPPA